MVGMLSEEELDLLRKLWDQGVSVRDISRILRVNPKILYVYVRVSGLKPRRRSTRSKISDKDLEIIRDLRFKGFSIREIARKLDVSPRTVSLYLKAMGLIRRRISRCPQISREDLLKLSIEGLRDIDIARKFNTSIACVSKYKKLYKISKRSIRKEVNKKKTEEIIDRIIRYIEEKGFTTNRELKQIKININEKILNMLSERDENIRWLKIKYTSTNKFTILPTRLGGLILIYKDIDKASRYIYSQIIDRRTPARVVKYLLKLNKIPQEIIDRIILYIRSGE